MSLHASATRLDPVGVRGDHGAARPPLVLLHGVTRSRGDWRSVMEAVRALQRAGTLVAIDQRGHGDAPRADRYLVVDYVADAVRFVRDEIGAPVVILGHSLGAMVAAGVAAALPDLVRGIILEDPPFHTMGERIGGTAWQAQFQGMHAAAIRGGSVDELAAAVAAIVLPGPNGGTVRLGDLRDPAAIRWSAECLARLDPGVLQPVIAGKWLDGYDPIRVARAIRCPVRLLQADPTAGGALSDADCAAFADAAPGCVVERFSGVGHLLHWMEPERVGAAVSGLLAETCRPHPRPD